MSAFRKKMIYDIINNTISDFELELFNNIYLDKVVQDEKNLTNYLNIDSDYLDEDDYNNNSDDDINNNGK